MFKTLFTYKIKNRIVQVCSLKSVFKTPPAWTSCDPQAGLENDHPEAGALGLHGRSHKP